MNAARPFRRPQACLFDLYGTLVDIHTDENQPSLWRRMAGFAALHGAVYAPAELRRSYLRLAAREEERLRLRDLGLDDAWPEIDLAQVFAALYAPVR